ncbi:MAG: metallophosphoesterase N-terminal domain-containing protein, partial [Fermentimonas sp.]|nr:metallophosphoesterase N-terminal domain-containing protein [Fermentimonas sp.]
MKKNLITIILIFISVAAYSQQVAKGFVYEDANRNGKKDRREAGIPNVSVSNGRDVVLTNGNGYYSITANEGNTIFVIKPSGYEIPVDNS